MKALIDKIPNSSTYAIPFLFFKDLDSDAFSKRVQVEDMRWDMARIEQIIQADLENDFGRMLKIKDAQYSQFDREILCSICLYKPEHQFKETWEYYYNYLKNRIHDFANNREEYGDQKLRCYVGDSCWDILHRDGVLKASHVDFIRMFDSSEYSYVGQTWRALAYDDFDYKCVYVADTDIRLHRYRSSPISEIFPPDEWHSCNFMALAPLLIPDPVWKVYSSHHMFSNIARILRLSDVCLFRCSPPIPFLKPAQLLQAVWQSSRQMLKVYDPERDMWTYSATDSHRQNDSFAHMGHIVFYLSKYLNVIIKGGVRPRRKLLGEIEADDLRKRLARQVWGEHEAFC